MLIAFVCLSLRGFAAQIDDIALSTLVDRSPIVVVGDLVKMEASNENEVLFIASFNIEEVLKGTNLLDDEEHLELSVPNNILRCKLGFENRRQLLFLRKTPKGGYEATYRNRSCIDVVQTKEGLNAVVGVPGGQEISMGKEWIKEDQLPGDIKREIASDSYVVFDGGYIVELPAVLVNEIQSIIDNKCKGK